MYVSISGAARRHFPRQEKKRKIWKRKKLFLSNRCNIMHQISCTFLKLFRDWHPGPPFGAVTQNLARAPSSPKSWLHACENVGFICCNLWAKVYFSWLPKLWKLVIHRCLWVYHLKMVVAIFVLKSTKYYMVVVVRTLNMLCTNLTVLC